MLAPLTVLASLATGTLAQQNAGFIGGLVQALQEANLTTLIQVATSINSTDVGNAFFSALDKGPLTLFAPNNNAFVGVPADVTSNTDVLANVLAYHLVSGNFTGITPTNTSSVVGSTFLNDDDFVELEGERNQALVWKQNAAGNGVIIANQNTLVQVLSTIQYQNITINVVDAVIDIPGNLSAVAVEQNFTGAAALFAPLAREAEGYTIFAPSDEVVSAATEAIKDLTANNTLDTVIRNHYVAGSTVYSTQLSDGQTLTTAAGSTIKVTVNTTGTYVTGGSTTAQVIKTDALTRNGVVHVIGGILVNTETNEGAAQSASSAASAAATATSAITGPVGAIPSASPSASVGPGGNNGGGSGAMLSASLSGPLIVLVGVVAGAAALL